MTHINFINNFLLSLCILAITSSCKSYSGQSKVKDSAKDSFDLFYIQDSIPNPIGYVNDFEYLFTESETLTLDNLLKNFDKKTSIQIVVITIDSTMTTWDNLDAFTLKIANAWGVGQKNKNNGVLVGISRAYGKMRIQNGYGIEKILTDTETKEIIDSAFIPGFRDAEYFKGTLTGLNSLMKILKERYN